jgi:hypothetical protein
MQMLEARQAMAFVLSLPVTPAGVRTEGICSRPLVFGSIRHLKFRMPPGRARPRGDNYSGDDGDTVVSRNSSSSAAGLSMGVLEPASDGDASESEWAESGEGNVEANAAFPADLCDVSGLGCMEDGSPPKNADQTLGPNKSFARSVKIDQAVTLVNYGGERASTIRDESVPT